MCLQLCGSIIWVLYDETLHTIKCGKHREYEVHKVVHNISCFFSQFSPTQYTSKYRISPSPRWSSSVRGLYQLYNRSHFWDGDYNVSHIGDSRVVETPESRFMEGLYRDANNRFCMYFQVQNKASWTCPKKEILRVSCIEKGINLCDTQEKQ